MEERPARLLNPVLLVGCAVILVGFSIRASFGVFQIPIAEEFGWARVDFSLAIAVQNLAWGVGQPIFGAIAERIGDRKAIVMGAVLYAVGLVLSAGATTPLEHQVYEVLVGFGIAGTGFGVILAVVGRAASDEHRSMALAIATASGSLGQVVGPPVAEALLRQMAWSSVFLVFAGAILAVLVLLPLMKAPELASKEGLQASLQDVLGRAFHDRNFLLIFVGFFSCGYQLAFITAHYPALITEMSASIDPSGWLASIGVTTTAALGALSLSIIGLANIAGTLTAGWAGDRFQRRFVLAGIYTGRTLIAAWFIAVPVTPTSVLVFSLVMGFLWLATVPLTSGLIAHIHGVRNMGTLFGVVFLSHQIGSFLGVWLGGRLYDVFGSYTTVWWIGVGVGVLSVVLHLLVDERPLQHPTPSSTPLA